jgi:hypothetical protein
VVPKHNIIGGTLSGVVLKRRLDTLSQSRRSQGDRPDLEESEQDRDSNQESGQTR